MKYEEKISCNSCSSANENSTGGSMSRYLTFSNEYNVHILLYVLMAQKTTSFVYIFYLCPKSNNNYK